MRIALVTDAWHPQINGVVRTLEKTIGWLRNRGHEVLIIEPSGFRTIPMPSYPEIRLSLFPGRKVARMLDAFSPEAMHVSTEGPLGLAARKYATRHGLPFTTFSLRGDAFAGMLPMPDEVPPMAPRPREFEFKHEEFQGFGEPEEPETEPGAEEQSGGVAHQPFVREGRKVGRNEPCPCGSGKKYKHCHGKVA